MRIIAVVFEGVSYLGLLLVLMFIYCAYFNPQEIAHVVCSLRTDNATAYAACRAQY